MLLCQFNFKQLNKISYLQNKFRSIINNVRCLNICVNTVHLLCFGFLSKHFFFASALLGTVTTKKNHISNQYIILTIFLVAYMYYIQLKLLGTW